MSALYGLEYALFFGVPDGKLELIEGQSRWAFPFLSRSEAESHFHLWLETFRRWKQVELATPICKSSQRWRVDVAGIRMELFPRPIEMRLPIDGKAFRAFYSTFNRRDYWPGQPEGLETGWDSAWDDGDIRMKLWSLFEDICDRRGGQHSNRVDIALGDCKSSIRGRCVRRRPPVRSLFPFPFFPPCTILEPSLGEHYARRDI